MAAPYPPDRPQSGTSLAARAFLPLVVLVLALLTSPPTASAWSYKEHIQLTRLSVARVLDDPDAPDGLKRWLRDVTPGLRGMDAEREFLLHARVGLDPVKTQPDLQGLPFYACEPDMLVHSRPRDSTVEPFDAHERKMHYVDVEFFLPEPTPNRYRHDLSGLPPMGLIPRDPADERFRQAGFLPFRIEQCHQRLIAALREGRLGSGPGDATQWAGYLLHYVQDNTQPHHGTVDYKSASYFADPLRAPNIHSEMEWRMLDAEEDDFMDLRTAYWPLFVAAMDAVTDPAATEADPWTQTLVVTYDAYDALPLIGLAAMHAAGQGGTPDAPRGRPSRPEFDTRAFFRFEGEWKGENLSVLEMKARQTALAVLRGERMLRDAWAASGR